MVTMQYRKVADIAKLEGNPRKIDKEDMERLKQSIEGLPDYFEAHPIVLSDRTGKLVVIDGNQRLEAARQLGLEEIPTALLSGLTEEKEREIIIRANVNNGEWDMDLLQEWDKEQLEDWGVDLGGEDFNADEFGEGFSLNAGDKQPFQQITFTLADEQAEFIKTAIDDIKHTEEYKYAETFGNENSNGNAIYLIVQQWVDAKK